jgi:hypothetical protein
MNMIERCRRESSASYNRYGGRGITVCAEWLDFSVFREWAHTNGYKDNLTIDRINNDGNYEPDNCRWATVRENAGHTSKTHNITVNGETHCAAEWARRTECDGKNICYWIKHYGLDIATQIIKHRLEEVK